MNPSYKTLALDQALQTTGFAVFDGLNLIAHGTFHIENDSDMAKRLGGILGQLNELYRTHEFDHLVFEGIQNQNNIETYKKLAYVQATILVWCYFNNIPYEILAPSTWRSILGGDFGKKRPEQKQHAIELVSDIFNIVAASDEADAICIGLAYQKGVESAW